MKATTKSILYYCQQITNTTHNIRSLHAGPQLTLSSVRNTFWPVNGRNVVRYVIRKCVTCFKFNPRRQEPLMGNLPQVRLRASRPFSSTGVDFAGPILIKEGTLRSRKLVKAYVCVFVCLTTKALHIELAGDLSTKTFLNTLKRFVARRGLCKNIYSDNPTNFVGSNNELKKM